MFEADGNDAARLTHDPVFKLLSSRDPRITIDLDPTDDRTHGDQQLSFFNWHYDSWCYLPLAGFLTFDAEPEQYLFCLLRPGKAAAKRGCLAMLKRLLPRLRKAFPKAEIRLRLDAGFTGSELYEFFEAHRLKYIVCMSKNDVLLRHAEPLMAPLREAIERGEAPQAVYGESRYQAREWQRERRVIIKAGFAFHPGRDPKENPRFIITKLTQSPRHIYQRIYCARGDAENRIKELKNCLAIDRTSCTRFKANQLWVLMTAAAYVLLQEIRLAAKHTACAQGQVGILRLRLLKISAWIEVSVRRIVSCICPKRCLTRVNGSASPDRWLPYPGKLPVNRL